jgi:hypothetical protein
VADSNQPPPGLPRRRHLIGKGETLSAEGSPKSRKCTTPPAPPRTFDGAVQHLRQRAQAVAAEVASLPQAACPDDQVVVMLTMHPEGQAKSHFPGSLLRGFDLTTVGSHKRHIQVDTWSGKPSATRLKAHEDHDGLDTIEMFVAGPRDSILRWTNGLDVARITTAAAQSQLGYIEDLRPVTALENRIRTDASGPELSLEVALHQMGNVAVLAAFERYVGSLGGRIIRDAILDLVGLTYVPTIIPAAKRVELERYSFLRSARRPGHLRSLPSLGAADLLRASALDRAITLPNDPPAMSSGLAKSIILDGGLPPDHGLPHVVAYGHPGLAAPEGEYAAHGLAVTAAAIYGDALDPTKQAIASEHYQVIGPEDEGDGFQALRVLARVREAIGLTDPHRPTFVNISLGPNSQLEDDYVHPWTSTLDELAAVGNRLITVAVGNNGEGDPATTRIQIPADGVNVLGVGAHDRRGSEWARAPYSAVGPGRRPGYRKPDLLAHGGCAEEPFLGVAMAATGHVVRPTGGTSFATPLVHHSGTQVHAVYDGALNPLAIRAIMVHTADPGTHDPRHVGYGRLASLNELLSVNAGEARVIYQGTITARKVLRARLPVPSGLISMVNITATLCVATPTSAADPYNYTNAGIDAWLVRDGSLPVNGDQELTEDHERFFSPPTPEYATESELRSIHHKWETVLHRQREFRPSSILSPCLDLRHIPRLGTMNPGTADPVSFALVVTVRCPKEPNIHDRILAEFKSLVQLQPVEARLPIRL